MTDVDNTLVMRAVMKLPSWYPFAGEGKPAPMPLLVVQAFLNTRYLEGGSDLLSDPETARRWLADAQLLSPAATVTPDELEVARCVRESIRGLLSARRAGAHGALALGPLRELVNEHSACLTVDEQGRLGLGNPRHDDVGDGMFDLLLIVRDAQEHGSWDRLKACGNPECQWAFYDRSRNRQGQWCEMALCGNRLKNRTFRARRR
jgi:predicted RNA-binding Zn ribbon-like protein